MTHPAAMFLYQARMDLLFLGYTPCYKQTEQVRNSCESDRKDMIGVGNSYSIPKGGVVGEEKCVVMD